MDAGVLCSLLELSTTAGIWKINQGHIAQMSLPCPSADEQVKFVSEANSVTSKAAEIEGIQSAIAEELNAMLPSILDRAFKGAL